jgi:ribonucleoside-diphosphate reductase alpha chain
MIIGPDGWSVWDAKQQDFNYPAPFDMTNMSLNYDNDFLYQITSFRASDGEMSPKLDDLPDTFMDNVRRALETGEPGFSFNFGDQENETLRNACTEVTSEDDSDVCNLGSINFANIDSIDELRDVVRVASKFLVCGTVRASLPYDKVYDVREKNRRLGLGIMGLHEWLLKRGLKYEMAPELREWLVVYRDESKRSADKHCDRLYLSRPVAYRAIAPTGSIGILAGTTTGIEPLFATAFKRRYLTDGSRWKYQFVVEPLAQLMIDEYGLKPEEIETALDLSKDPERRIRFQADVQDYVDMAISSTINLPAWGSKENNEDHVESFAQTLAKYAPRLRGFTCYPDGSRGGQPLMAVPYEDAVEKKGVVYEETDICDLTGRGGTCGA